MHTLDTTVSTYQLHRNETRLHNHSLKLSPTTLQRRKHCIGFVSHDTTTNMSQPSLTNFIVKRPWLNRWMTPLANWYCNAAGYRKLGLRYDSRKPLHSIGLNSSVHWHVVSMC